MMRAATRLGEEPVGDLLSLLERADPTRDRQVVALIGSLRSLAERIGGAAQ